MSNAFWYTQCKSGLAVFAEPRANSTHRGNLGCYSVFPELNKAGDWVQHNAGWSLTKSTVNGERFAMKVSQPVYKVVHINGVNVRSGPSTSSKIKGRATKGMYIRQMTAKGHWIKHDFGWSLKFNNVANQQFLELQKPGGKYGSVMPPPAHQEPAHVAPQQYTPISAYQPHPQEHSRTPQAAAYPYSQHPTYHQARLEQPQKPTYSQASTPAYNQSGYPQQYSQPVVPAMNPTYTAPYQPRSGTSGYPNPYELHTTHQEPLRFQQVKRGSTAGHANKFLCYLDWQGTKKTVEIRGDKFYVTVHGETTAQVHDSIYYKSWDNSPWQAKIVGRSVEHSSNGQSFLAQYVNYKTWDGTDWTANLVYSV